MSADSCSFVPLAILVERTTGGGTPPRGVPSFWGGDIPWASVKDFSDNEIDLHSTEESITLAGLAASAARLIAAGTPLVCTRMAVGRCAAAAKPVAINQDLKALEPSQGVDNRFLLHALKRLQPALQARAVGSTVKGIALRDLLSAQVIRLPLPEQRRVAEILDTLDEAIRKTEQVIAKVQQMKQGLLHDLLTRGIDDDGELRDPDRHPEQFKDSPLGRIPREWEVGSLRSFYSEPHRNGLYKPNSYHGRGPLMIQMGGIFKGLDADFSGAIRVQVSPIEVRTYGLRQGDLLFARRSLVLEGAGKCSLVRSLPEPATFESSIVRVHVDQQRLRPEFVALYLDSSGSYLQRRKCIRQVAVSGVSGADISAFPVPCPSLGEQDGIVARHRTLCSRLGEEKTELDKVHTLKHGLMDDLLTGRVRVSVPEEAAA